MEMTLIKIAFVTTLALLWYPIAAGASPIDTKWTRGECRRLLDAMVQVESGGRLDLVGDNGKAIGPLQIHRIYWVDAVRYDKTLLSLGGKYEDCKRLEYAEKVVVAYWNCYASKTASCEELARIHNGGPKGFGKKATEAYWAKVNKEMSK